MFSSLVKLFQKGLNRRLLPSHLIEVPVKINSDSRKTIDLKKEEKKRYTWKYSRQCNRLADWEQLKGRFLENPSFRGSSITTA